MSLEAEWTQFRPIMVPDDASPTQYHDMKSSFYSGAMATLVILNEAGALDRENPLVAAALEALNLEMDEFIATIERRETPWEFN